jgi:putative copper resistance protein D
VAATDVEGVARARRLIVASWVIATSALIALAAAVLHYLSEPGATATSPMQMSGAVYRAGSGAIGQPLLGVRLLTAWQLDSAAVALVVLAAAAYLTAVCLVPLRTAGRSWPKARTASFLAGLLVCVLATNSSIAVYDEVLFSAHMIGHLALVMAAPVLLVSGRPLRLTLLVARPASRERLQSVIDGRVASVLSSPPVALACYAIAIVGTHLTGLMGTIMRVAWAGQLEHLVYLLVGCQFFALVIGDEPIRWRLSHPARWLLLALGMAIDTFTGVVLLQSASPIAMLPAGFTVDALSDTRTGGAIMWFGGDAIMAVVMIVLVVSWLHRPDARRADDEGWAERARRATFEAHTGTEATSATVTDFDDTDAARLAYNEWLANLAGKD